MPVNIDNVLSKKFGIAVIAIYYLSQPTPNPMYIAIIAAVAILCQAYLDKHNHDQ